MYECAGGQRVIKRKGERERERSVPSSEDEACSLTLEQMHGLCTGAYPSSSRTSSPPG